MSDLENLYRSPESQIIPEESQVSGPSLNETMLRHLNDASPWLRFVGIIGYISSGFICVIGLIMAIGMSAASGLFEEFGNFPGWLFSFIYIPMGVLFFFPAHFTYNFGKKIRNYRFSNSSEELELAFKYNKSLWKFYGILCIIYLAFIPVSIIAGIIIGVAATLGGF